MVFSVLLIIPLIIAIAGYVLGKGLVTPKELALQIGAQILIAGISAAVVYWSDVGDTEVWNGVVTKKYSEHVSCTHSYRCHCHEVCSGSGKNRSCSEECDTCYDHLFDVDWNVETSNPGEEFDIDREDRQGLIEPDRFKAVVIGEPTARPHSFTIAQVPAMYVGDLEKVYKSALSARYGEGGSKAVFQFIQEHNPNFNDTLYTKIQETIEAGRNSFEADQKTLLDKRRVYQNTIGTFPSGAVARMFGFPRVDLKKYDPVINEETAAAFATKKAGPISLTAPPAASK